MATRGELGAYGFHDPVRASDDIQAAQGTYRELRAGMEYDQQGQPCVGLTGTVPIMISGVQYHIPVKIMIMRDFPVSAPSAYVTPTPDMQITQDHQHVRAGDGYCHSASALWSHEIFSLFEFINRLVQQFSEKSPVHQKVKELHGTGSQNSASPRHSQAWGPGSAGWGGAAGGIPSQSGGQWGGAGAAGGGGAQGQSIGQWGGAGAQGQSIGQWGGGAGGGGAQSQSIGQWGGGGAAAGGGASWGGGGWSQPSQPSAGSGQQRKDWGPASTGTSGGSAAGGGSSWQQPGGAASGGSKGATQQDGNEGDDMQRAMKQSLISQHGKELLKVLEMEATLAKRQAEVFDEEHKKWEDSCKLTQIRWDRKAAQEDAAECKSWNDSKQALMQNDVDDIFEACMPADPLERQLLEEQAAAEALFSQIDFAMQEKFMADPATVAASFKAVQKATREQFQHVATASKIKKLIQARRVAQ
eukprot:TRINITY_DN3717_c0_g1_i1.p1 TRINITY_DN3717_c0_g1~~TRINITY_DN3717_c0_g1_i1.p1  ORF type:complete len:503 (+),score=147.82 TRINITY_DN3717_c0_g1_i1:100-1509(+)